MTNEQVLSGTLSAIAHLAQEIDKNEQVIQPIRQAMEQQAVRMQELEATVKSLESERDKLRAENLHLTHELKRLSETANN